MRYISIDSAQPGMIVGKSIYNEQGSILVNYRVKLTERLILRMRDIGLAGLYIEDELSSDITVEDLISDELGVKATKALTKLDIDAALKVASDITEELSLNGDINVNLISMRTNSDYTYKHSVNVAVLSVLTGIGIGLIGKGAVEAIGRQPSAAGDIRTSMLIMGALVEGVALFAIVVCFLGLFQ